MHVVLDHQADAIGRVVDGELGRTDHQHHCREQQRTIADDLAQLLQAAINTDVGAQGEQHSDQADHCHLQGKGIRDADQAGQAAGQGRSGKRQGHGECAHHGQQEDQVDDATDWAGSLEAGDCFNDRGQVQAALLAHVEVVSHRQRCQGVDRPRTDTPVEERVADAVLQGFTRLRDDVQAWSLVVVGPFHHAPVESRRPHAGADEHEHPRGGGVFRLAGTQANVAVFAEGDIKHSQRAAEDQQLHTGTKGTSRKLE
ncbi:hypothetical protein D9M71_195760 [compost metagenome]